jgi:hypothetical protein
MYEQFDKETMNRALKRPFPVEEDIPDEFVTLLRQLDQPPPRKPTGRSQWAQGRRV